MSNISGKVIGFYKDEDAVIIDKGRMDGVHTKDTVLIIDRMDEVDVGEKKVNVYKYKKELQVVQVHEDYCLAQRIVKNTEFNKTPLGSSLSIISQMNSLTTTVENVVPINSDKTKQVLDLSKLTNKDVVEGDICIIMSNI